MKRQFFFALAAATLLSNVAFAKVPASIRSEQIAVRENAVNEGTVLPCGKLANVSHTAPEKLIEPGQVASAESARPAARIKGTNVIQ